MNIIDSILRKQMLLSGMVSVEQMHILLKTIDEVIHLDGELVELGCNMGTTSVYIQRYLQEIKTTKRLHVYDSFEGLPKGNKFDEISLHKKYEKGSCKCAEFEFIDSFKISKLNVPIINKGWFSEISDDKYPNQICFAFFDGDFYDSIIASFDKVYHKMVTNGKILVHDFGYQWLPGVKIACEHFLKDKQIGFQVVKHNMAIITKHA
jgi:O-methyltransferase